MSPQQVMRTGDGWEVAVITLDRGHGPAQWFRVRRDGVRQTCWPGQGYTQRLTEVQEILGDAFTRLA